MFGSIEKPNGNESMVERTIDFLKRRAVIGSMAIAVWFAAIDNASAKGLEKSEAKEKKTFAQMYAEAKQEAKEMKEAEEAKKIAEREKRQNAGIPVKPNTEIKPEESKAESEEHETITLDEYFLILGQAVEENAKNMAEMDKLTGKILGEATEKVEQSIQERDQSEEATKKISELKEELSEIGVMMREEFRSGNVDNKKIAHWTARCEDVKKELAKLAE